MVIDIYHTFGSDVVASTQGDLHIVEGTTTGEQRVLRRLLTNPGSYLWHLNYGAGLARYIGKPLTQALYQEIKGLITSQLQLEDAVAKNPAPVIDLQSTTDGLYCNIQYTDAVQQTPVTLSFTVSE